MGRLPQAASTRTRATERPSGQPCCPRVPIFAHLRVQWSGTVRPTAICRDRPRRRVYWTTLARELFPRPRKAKRSTETPAGGRLRARSMLDPACHVAAAQRSAVAGGFPHGYPRGGGAGVFFLLGIPAPGAGRGLTAGNCCKPAATCVHYLRNDYKWTLQGYDEGNKVSLEPCRGPRNPYRPTVFRKPFGSRTRTGGKGVPSKHRHDTC